MILAAGGGVHARETTSREARNRHETSASSTILLAPLYAARGPQQTAPRPLPLAYSRSG